MFGHGKVTKQIRDEINDNEVKIYHGNKKIIDVNHPLKLNAIMML